MHSVTITIPHRLIAEMLRNVRPIRGGRRQA